MKQAQLANKADTYDSVEKTIFDKKLKKIKRKVTLNKTKHLEIEKKLTVDN